MNSASPVDAAFHRVILFELMDGGRFVNVSVRGHVDEDVLGVLEQYIARQRQRICNVPGPEIATPVAGDDEKAI